MKIKFAMLIAATGLVVAGTAGAESLVDGDAEAGKARAIVCTACHGPEGNSSTPLWPNIAGQSASYSLAQLRAFKDGKRSDPLMTPQAMMLSDEDMVNLAVYFESLPAASQTVANPATVEGAEALYRGGDMADQTSACLACHGPSGAGNPAAEYPAIAGQHAAYTAKQLRDYRSGARSTDGPTRMMQDIAATLNDDEIDALSSYIQGLH